MDFTYASPLKLCEKFGVGHGVEYNLTKFVCFYVYRKKRCLPQVFLAARSIALVTTTKHLGNLYKMT